MTERAPEKEQKMQKPAEKSETFMKLIERWQNLEDTTMQYADEMMQKTDNRLITTLMEMIRDDSQKHKAMQQMIIDSVTKEALHLRPEELALIADFLTRHIEAEGQSIALAKEALDSSELFSTRFILSMLIADENKHHDLLCQLDDLKKATVMVT